MGFRSRLCAFLGLTVGVLASTVASAQVPALVNPSAPITPLIGDEECVTVNFVNASGPTGFGPYVVVTYAEGILINSVKFVDIQPRFELIGTFDSSGQLTDPISGRPVTGTEGGKAYVVRYPIGSVDVGTDPLPLEICGAVETGAAIGTPLPTSVTPGFEFGDSATGTTPIVGTPINNTVTPQLAIIRKTNTAPESERPPGPIHTFAYNYTMDISAGVLLTGVEIVDSLPGNIQWTGSPAVPVVNAPLGIGCNVAESPNTPAVGPGGNLRVTCTGLAGTDADVDLSISLPVYVTDILDETVDDSRAIRNTVNVSYNHRGTAYTDSDNSDLTAVHAALQKSVSGTANPGNLLTYALRFQVTEYTAEVGAAANAFVITDVVPDGLQYQNTIVLRVNGETIAVTPNVTAGPGAGQTTLVWDVAAAYQAAKGSAIPGGAVGSLQYQAQVLERYSDGVTPVQSGDPLTNSARLDYALSEGANGQNGTGATATVPANTPSKSIVDPNPLPPNLSPGQRVTFRLALEIPSGNSSAVVLRDLLPRPVFDVADFNTNSDWAVVSPNPRQNVTVSKSTANNSITFNFGDVDLRPGETLAVEFSIPVTGQPFADNLFLTNLLESSYQNAQGQRFTGLRAVGLTVGAPELSITKGVLSIDNPGAVISPAPPADPGASLADSNGAGADAFDTVVYAITVENVGSQPAYNVKIREGVIPRQTCDANNVTVDNGNGQRLTFSGNILGTNGIQLDAPLAGNDGTVGAPFADDTAIVRVSCTLDVAVTPAETLTSSASVSWESVISGGGAFPVREDSASVAIARPSLSKQVINIAPGYSNRLNRAQIGELVTYELNITIPEGTSPLAKLDDILDVGLAQIDILTLTSSSGDLTTDVTGGFDAIRVNNAGFRASGSGDEAIDRRLVFGPSPQDAGFGTLTNVNRDNGTPEIIRMTYRTRVINNLTNVKGKNLKNKVRWRWTPTGLGEQTEQIRAANVQIVEPILQVGRTFTPDVGDVTTPPRVDIALAYNNASNGEGFDFTLVDTLPELTRVDGSINDIAFSAGCPINRTVRILPGRREQILVEFSGYADTGTGCLISYPTRFSASVVAGSELTGCSVLKWQSLAGQDQPLPPSPNRNPLAVERTGDITDPGAGANSYLADDCDEFKVFDVGIEKRVESTDQRHTDNIPGTPAGAESLTIGESIVFELIVTVPPATASNLQVTDNLPNTEAILEAVAIDSITVGRALAADNPNPTAVFTDSNGDGINDTISLDFGNVNNPGGASNPADERIAIQVRAKVRDVLANVSNDRDKNVAVATFSTGGNTADIASDEYLVELVEPDMTITKRGSATELEGGDVITYILAFEHTDRSRAAAQNLVLTDNLPLNLSLVPGSAKLGALCTDRPNSGPTETLNGIRVEWNQFDLDAKCEVEFQARVNVTALAGQQITNTSALAWTSLSTTGDADDRAYETEATWTFSISGPGLSKTISNTDQAITRLDTTRQPAELTIGETVTFQVVAEFQEGTTRNVVVRDQLPTDNVLLRVTRAEIVRLGSDLILGGGQTVGSVGVPCAVPNAQSCREWQLGAVVNRFDSRRGFDEADSIVFEIDAIVVDDSINSGAPGVDKGNVNNAELRSPDANLFASEQFDLVEPLLTIEKTNADGSETKPTRANAQEGFVLTLSHLPNSTAAAQNVVITENLDATMIWQGQGSVTTDCPNLIIDDRAAGAPDYRVVFEISALPTSTQRCEIAFPVTMQTSLVNGGLFTNTANLRWESAPGSAESRTGQDAASASVFAVIGTEASKAVLTTSLPETGSQQGDPNIPDVTIGEVIEYSITAGFEPGTSTGVTVTDTFQATGGRLTYTDGRIEKVGDNIRYTGSGSPPQPIVNPIAIDYQDVINSRSTGSTVVDEDDIIAYSLSLRVDNDPVNQGNQTPIQTLENRVRIQVDGTNQPEKSVLVEVVEPRLTLTKNFSELKSGVATIRLQAGNTGTAPAYDLTITDEFSTTDWQSGSLKTIEVPDGFEIVETTAGGVITVTVRPRSPSDPTAAREILFPNQTTDVVFSMALVNGGTTPSAGTLPNTATLMGSTLPGTNANERSYTVTASDALRLPRPALEKTWVVPSAAAFAVPGEAITYTLRVRNTGDADLSNVVVTDTPDALGRFVAGSVRVAPGTNRDGGTVINGNKPADTSVEVSFTAIDANREVSINYDVTVPNPYPAGTVSAQRLVNQATLRADQVSALLSDDPTVAPGTADPTVVPVEADPVMTLTKTSDKLVVTGGTLITYDLAIGNAGNQNATGVLLSDTVPANTRLVPSLSTRGWRCVPDFNAGARCELATSLIGGTRQIAKFVVAVDRPLASGVTQIDNRADVEEDGIEFPNISGPKSTATDTDALPVLALPLLSIDKDDGGISVGPGAQYAYRIEYSNRGNQAATNVVITETVPEFTRFDASVSTTGWQCADGSPPGTICLFNVGTLAGGTTASVNFGLRTDFPAETRVTGMANTAAIRDDGSNSSGVVLTDSDDDTTPLIANPDLVIRKTADADRVRLQQVIRYTLDYSNVGNQNTDSVVIREIVPPGTAFNEDASKPTVWTCSDGATGGTVCRTGIGNLSAGDGDKVNFAVNVVEQTDNEKVINIAEIDDALANGLDPTPQNNITTLVLSFPEAIMQIPTLPRYLLFLLVIAMLALGGRSLMRVQQR